MADNMKPLAVIFVLVTMVLSVAGYALMGSNSQQAPEAPEIPSVIREPIDTQTQVQILRSGSVLIEHFYSEDCEDCVQKNAKLEEFISRLPGYVVLNEVQGNDTRLDMIGIGGRIVDISGNSLEYEELIDQYCEVAIAQPRACILRSIDSGGEENVTDSGNETEELTGNETSSSQ